MESKNRIIVYVDGFNFYHGLKDKKWRKFYWLDVVSFFEKFMKPDQELIEVNYFSAPSLDSEKSNRQDLFFSANKLNPRFNLFLGKYISKPVTCFKCKHKYLRHEEKKTDVSIATQLIGNFIKQRCDVSILVSADSDLIPPLEFIRELNPKHKIFAYFPPKRYSSDLFKFCDNSIYLERYEARFSQNILSDEITLKNGFIAKRPIHWK